MKLSIMLFPFHGDLKEGKYTATEMLEKFYSVGIRGLEPMLSGIDALPEVWEETHKAAASLGMGFTCFDLGANLVGTCDEDREAALETVVRGVELCKKFDCPVALLPGSGPAKGMSNDEGRHIYSKQLAKAAKLTSDLGVTLSIEDFGVTPEFTCHSSHVLEVVQNAGPEIKVTWDSGNFMIADEMPLEAYAPLKSRMVHVHIKDWAPVDPNGEVGLQTPLGKRWVGAQIGQGSGQVREVIEKLHADGYDGWISLEVGVAPALEAGVIGANYVKGVWDSLG